MRLHVSQDARLVATWCTLEFWLSVRLNVKLHDVLNLSPISIDVLDLLSISIDVLDLSSEPSVSSPCQRDFQLPALSRWSAHGVPPLLVPTRLGCGEVLRSHPKRRSISTPALNPNAPARCRLADEYVSASATASAPSASHSRLSSDMLSTIDPGSGCARPRPASSAS